MPTYEYVCEPCGGKAEIVHGIKEDPEVICPKCKGPMTRLISGGGGVIFHGSGFFCNDYPKEPKSKKGIPNGL